MIAKMRARGIRCSFCGKSRREVPAIVAGAPHASRMTRPILVKSSFICSECVRRFNRLLTSSEIKGTLVPTSSPK